MDKVANYIQIVNASLRPYQLQEWALGMWRN